MNNREYSFPAYLSPVGEVYKDVKDCCEPSKCYSIKELLDYAARGMEFPVNSNSGDYDSDIQGITDDALEDASVNVVEDLSDCDDIIPTTLENEGRRKANEAKKQEAKRTHDEPKEPQIAPKEQASEDAKSE
jgi:hypothetical protein